MNQRNAYVLGAIAGAAVGALAGFLFLTPRGRRTLAGARQLVSQVAREIDRARPLWYKMRLALEYRERDLPATYDVQDSAAAHRAAGDDIMNRPVVVLGAVLAVAGVALLISVLTGGIGADPALPSENIPQFGTPAENGAPSRVWAIVAGLALAAGAALVMLGMNRWRQPNRRRA